SWTPCIAARSAAFYRNLRRGFLHYDLLRSQRREPTLSHEGCGDALCICAFLLGAQSLGIAPLPPHARSLAYACDVWTGREYEESNWKLEALYCKSRRYSLATRFLRSSFTR